MKFTDGYWHVKPRFEPTYAVEVYETRVAQDSLTLYLATRRLSNRGATLNMPMLTVTLRSPQADAIKVEMLHFDGAYSDAPVFEKNEENYPVQIEQEENAVRITSGNLTAVVCTKENAFAIDYFFKGRKLTGTAFRNMAYMRDRNTNERFMLEQLELDVGEYVYGLGERFTPFVKNGQVVDMWNEDGGTASEIAYKNIPFYMSGKGYGVFVDHSGDVSFELGSEKVERVSFSVKGEKLDYYIFGGDTPADVLGSYTALTGRPALPPAWSFGLWLSTSFTTDYDEATVTSFIDGMREREIPLSVFHFDCFWMKGGAWCDFEWDPRVFPDPEGMLRRYKEKDLHICVWINSYLGQMAPLFKEAKERGYLIKKTDGSVWQTDMWQAGMGVIDFTNPDACKWYQGKLKGLLDMGVDAFKTDFGERIPVRDIAYYDGSDPVRMHNYYTYLYNKTVFECLEEARGKGEATLFARSATAGGQKFPVHWGGDCSAQYVSMAETLRGGLSLALCGFGFWSHDIGGFEATGSADLYKRWCAFGLLSSHSRLHGSSSYRVPWAYDEEASNVLRFFTRLKMRLMPYLYGQAVKAHETGIPMLRPMFFEFPHDPVCETLDLQYMLGDSMLVAPVFREDGQVRFYLPEGRWTNYFTGKVYEGGRYYTETHGYMSLPLMVRENAVLALGGRADRPDYDYCDGLALRLFEIADGACIGVNVPDMQGEVAVSAQVTRMGDTVAVKLSRPLDKWSVEWGGMQAQGAGDWVEVKAT